MLWTTIWQCHSIALPLRQGKSVLLICFEETRLYVIQRIGKYVRNGKGFYVKLDKNLDEHSHWEVIHLGENMLEVRSGRQGYGVTLDTTEDYYL